MATMEITTPSRIEPSQAVQPGTAQGDSCREPEKRRVEVVTVPVKDVGPFRKAAITFASWVLGSSLTWAMHWAIRVDGTYFELQRPGGLAKPRLRASRWSEEREREIISTHPMGWTSLSNDEIITASEPYFTKETSAWYNLLANNCQLFVNYSLDKIVPINDGVPTPIPPRLQRTITHVLHAVFSTLALPPTLVYLQWLRWRGCDEKNIQVCAMLLSVCTTMMAPLFIVVVSNNYYMLKEMFETHSLLFAATAAFPTSVSSAAVFLVMPVLGFPVAKKRASGTWVVSSRLKQNNEDVVDPEEKIEVTFPFLPVLVGGCIGFILWVAVASPYIVHQSAKFLHSNLSFRNPWSFLASVWAILMTPLFDTATESRSNAKLPEKESREEFAGRVVEIDSEAPAAGKGKRAGFESVLSH